MDNLKEWMDAQWQAKGVQYAGHGVVYENAGDNAPPRTRAGTQRVYKSKEQKAYEARFGIYNKKLVPVILAEATPTMRNMEVPILDKYGRPEGSEIKNLPEYRWPAHEKAAPVESVPRKQRDGEAGSRRRISRVKLAQAQAILAKVPQDELASFLARFGLSMSLAASIASLDNIEQITRQFLRATL